MPDKIETLHLLKITYGFMGSARFVCELSALLESLDGSAREALTPHMETLASFLKDHGYPRPSARELALACLYPGLLRRVDPVACLTPGRGGFSERRLQEATSAIRRVSALESFRQWLRHPFNERITRHTAGELPDLPQDDDLLRFADALGKVDSRRGADLEVRLLAAYTALSLAEGWALARRALRWLDADSYRIADEGGKILEFLACLLPGSLNSIHAALLDRAHLYPGYLYSGADSSTCERLVHQIETETNHLRLSHALVALAWVGDEIAQKAFQRWRSQPPAWAGKLYIPPADYTFEAGWHMATEGRRQNLYSSHCYRLNLVSAAKEDGESPVQAVTPYGENCGWCGRALVNLLELYTTDVRLAFIGWSGTRLQIPICERCSYYDTLFAEISADGMAHWSSRNGPAPDTYERMGGALPQRQLVLGPACQTPFEGLLDDRGHSQIGGYPKWVDDAYFPACPGCEQPMHFVAQVLLAELGEAPEGMMYAFLCSACRMTATFYQQT